MCSNKRPAPFSIEKYRKVIKDMYKTSGSHIADAAIVIHIISLLKERRKQSVLGKRLTYEAVPQL